MLSFHVFDIRNVSIFLNFPSFAFSTHMMVLATPINLTYRKKIRFEFIFLHLILLALWYPGEVISAHGSVCIYVVRIPLYKLSLSLLLLLVDLVVFACVHHVTLTWATSYLAREWMNKRTSEWTTVQCTVEWISETDIRVHCTLLYNSWRNRWSIFEHISYTIHDSTALW